MRPCPACGAGNHEAARWCTQCYADLTVPPGNAAAMEGSAELDAVTAAAEEVRDTEPVSASERATDPDGPDPHPDTGLRRGEHGLEWVCLACSSINPIAASHCSACGLPFAARFAVAQTGPPVDWKTARAASMLLPGFGHVRAGAAASGVTRIVLFLVWAVGGVLVLMGAGLHGLAVAGPLLGGAAAVHVITQWDLRALERGAGSVLEGRVLLGLVAVVTVLILLGTAAGLGDADVLGGTVNAGELVAPN